MMPSAGYTELTSAFSTSKEYDNYDVVWFLMVNCDSFESRLMEIKLVDEEMKFGLER